MGVTAGHGADDEGQCAEADESAPSERRAKQWNLPKLLVRELQRVETVYCGVCVCVWASSIT